VQAHVVDAAPLLATSGDGEFIFAAYHHLFHRPPDIDGLLDYRFLLRKGLSRIQVLRALEQSEEGRKKRVQLKNLPSQPEMRFLHKLAFHGGLKISWLLWRILDRPSEAVEQRIHIADPARFWDLTYQATSTLIHRQQVFESQLHIWRREMEEDALRVQDALNRLSAAHAAEQSAKKPVLDPGEIEFEGRRFAVAGDQWLEVARIAVDRHVTAGVRVLLDRLLQPGMVVADAGAGVGVLSILAGDRIQPGGKVYAFEPSSAHFALLLRNLEANGRLASGAAIAQPHAVGACCGAARADGAPAAQVSLDAAMTAEPRVDLVRLSLDGDEAAAIEGMWRIIESNARLRILWDCRPASLAARGQSMAEVLKPLLAAGFHASRVCPVTGTLLPMPQSETSQPVALLLQRDSAGRPGA
jgi:FkbM family methyltransferase